MITTYLSNNEQEIYSAVKDSEVDELLQQVRSMYGGKFFLQERKCIEQRFFRKNKEFFLYSLYIDCGNMPEVQILNFPPMAGSNNSFNTWVHKSYVMTYFYGLLGHEQEIKKAI